jgi:hypothetical protein
MVKKILLALEQAEYDEARGVKQPGETWEAFVMRCVRTLPKPEGKPQ